MLDACVWSTAFVKFNWEASWAFGCFLMVLPFGFGFTFAAALHSHGAVSFSLTSPTAPACRTYVGVRVGVGDLVIVCLLLVSP